MRTHLARSIVAVVVLSVLCGCSSGRGKSWSMASMNPFNKSSKELAGSTAPRFEKPSASANPADSLPSAPEYASTSDRSATYPEKTAAYSGYNGTDRAGYQYGQSSYSSTAPSSSAGYAALSSSPPAVSPQYGYYNSSGTDYNTASRSNSPAPGYSYSGSNSPSGSAGLSSNSYAATRDSAYPSTSRDTVYTGDNSSFGNRTDSGSRYATGSERWGTSSAASGYDYPRSSSAGSNASYPSSGSSASPWFTTGPAATGSASDGGSRFGGGTGSLEAAPSADRYGYNAGYLSDSTPSSSFRDRQASAYTGSSSSGSGYGYIPTSPSPQTEPATVSRERAAYVPGQTGYAPGSTGYTPPNTPSYQLPAGNYTVPDTTGSESGYSPGSIDRYRTDGSSGSRPIGTYPSSSDSQSGSSYGYKLPLSG